MLPQCAKPRSDEIQLVWSQVDHRFYTNMFFFILFSCHFVSILYILPGFRCVTMRPRRCVKTTFYSDEPDRDSAQKYFFIQVLTFLNK